MGVWSDHNLDGWHDFSLTDRTNQVTVTDELEILIGLRWDDAWGGSANDYDLFLFRQADGGYQRSRDGSLRLHRAGGVGDGAHG